METFRKCEQWRLNGDGEIAPCTNAAVETVWCPTWLNRDGTMPQVVTGWQGIKRGSNHYSDSRVMHVCSECLEPFRRSYERHGEGSFYFGGEAILKQKEIGGK